MESGIDMHGQEVISSVEQMLKYRGQCITSPKQVVDTVVDMTEICFEPLRSSDRAVPLRELDVVPHVPLRCSPSKFGTDLDGNPKKNISMGASNYIPIY